MAKTIAIGCDHAGYVLKEKLKAHLSAKGHTLLDKGTNGPESVDYPDFAHAVAKAVSDGSAELGLLICGSGNGVNITANKHTGIRSALAWRPDVAALARQHNNATVLALPARFVTEPEALAIAEAFLEASFEGGRHQVRVEKIETNC
jgi:ribose 5-phosphate isomerase B